MMEPSASLKDNFTVQKEMEFLQESLKFIKDLGLRLLLSQTCVSTAQYFFHKVTIY